MVFCSFPYSSPLEREVNRTIFRPEVVIALARQSLDSEMTTNFAILTSAAATLRERIRPLEEDSLEKKEMQRVLGTIQEFRHLWTIRNKEAFERLCSDKLEQVPSYTTDEARFIAFITAPQMPEGEAQSFGIEGGRPHRMLYFLHKELHAFLTLDEEGKALFEELTPDELEEVKRVFKVLADASTIYKSQFIFGCCERAQEIEESEWFLEHAVKGCRAHIQSLKVHEHCLIPGGFFNHHFFYKITRMNENQFELEIYNTGRGAIVSGPAALLSLKMTNIQESDLVNPELWKKLIAFVRIPNMEEVKNILRTQLHNAQKTVGAQYPRQLRGGCSIDPFLAYLSLVIPEHVYHPFLVYMTRYLAERINKIVITSPEILWPYAGETLQKREEYVKGRVVYWNSPDYALNRLFRQHVYTDLPKQDGDIERIGVVLLYPPTKEKNI